MMASRDGGVSANHQAFHRAGVTAETAVVDAGIPRSVEVSRCIWADVSVCF